jgi:hypothetical protein
LIPSSEIPLTVKAISGRQFADILTSLSVFTLPLRFLFPFRMLQTRELLLETR